MRGGHDQISISRENSDNSMEDGTEKGQPRQQKRGTVPRLLKSYRPDTMVASTKAEVNIKKKFTNIKGYHQQNFIRSSD